MKANSSVRNVCLFGASPDTGNRGVTALCHSVIWHLHSHNVEKITVFDHARGVRSETIDFGGFRVPITRCGAVNSKRIYRSENYWNIRMSTWMHSRFNPAANCIQDADAVYDVSAGDSFTDLYGDYRFRSIVLPKQIALDAGKPLVLLPQTYGPFRYPETQRIASDLVRRSHMAWARDAVSFQALKDLLGQDFDPAKHRQGVDMAFALPPVAPTRMSEELRNWLSPEQRLKHEVIGLNVRGLIYNKPGEAAAQFGLKADYPELVHRFLRWVLKNTQARVVLVPHVTTESGNPESDPDAAHKIVEWLDEQYRDRVQVSDPDYSPSELKWLIGQTSWFCGTRMHSTIAALGSGVPTAAVSYSLKTRGVFETCGQQHQSFELRHQTTDEILDAMQESFLRRDHDRRKLAERIPQVIATARQQLDEILKSLPMSLSPAWGA
jgi:colanic acid/amylovoran biosynthesis protein